MMWRAVTFGLNNGHAGRRLSEPQGASSGVDHNLTNASNRPPLQAGTRVLLRIAEVEAELRVLLTAQADISLSQDSTTGEMTALILEYEGQVAAQIVQTVLVLPARLSSQTGTEVVFSSPPTIVFITVSAPPPPPQPPKLPPPHAPPTEPVVYEAPTNLSAAVSQSLSVDDQSTSPVSIIIATILGVVAILVLVTVGIYWRRRKRGAKEVFTRTANDVPSIDPWDAEQRISKQQPESIAEPLTNALADAPTALQRIRSLRMRNTPPPTNHPAPAWSPGEDDVDGINLELELGMEFDILREHRERRATNLENYPRLQKRRLQVERADALLLAQQNRERSVIWKKLLHDLPPGHHLLTFDPDSLANRNLVFEQAAILVTTARRRARARLFAADRASADASLDPITGVIKRASLTGGRLHAFDLTSQSIRTERRPDAWLGEPDPMKWLLGILSDPRDFAEPSPSIHNRLTRARERRYSNEGLVGGESGVLQPSPMRRAISESIIRSPAKPRSLFEIRATSQSPRRERSDSELPHPGLDPLTNNLHTASMMGLELPPPPGQWREEEFDVVKIARDAPERVRRARRDSETRPAGLGNSPARRRLTLGDNADATRGSPTATRGLPRSVSSPPGTLNLKRRDLNGLSPTPQSNTESSPSTNTSGSSSERRAAALATESPTSSATPDKPSSEPKGLDPFG